jgi:hypothetical protein
LDVLFDLMKDKEDEFLISNPALFEAKPWLAVRWKRVIEWQEEKFEEEYYENRPYDRLPSERTSSASWSSSVRRDVSSRAFLLADALTATSQLDVTAELLRMGASVNQLNSKGRSLLHTVILQVCLSFLNRLVVSEGLVVFFSNAVLSPATARIPDRLSVEVQQTRHQPPSVGRRQGVFRLSTSNSARPELATQSFLCMLRSPLFVHLSFDLFVFLLLFVVPFPSGREAVIPQSQV